MSLTDADFESIRENRQNPDKRHLPLTFSTLSITEAII